MAVRWLREIISTGTGGSTGLPFFSKCCYLFLKYVCGYTSIEVSDTDYDAYELTGVNGEWNLSGADYVFRDSISYSFSAGDVGKFILVVSSNKINAGIYAIASYIDPGSVTLNYRANTVNGERFPAAETGLTWYKFSSSTSVPTGNEAYWRMRSPSAKAWEVELRYNGSFQQRLACRVCLDGNWAGSKILQTAFAGSANSSSTYNYFVTDTDGSYLAFLIHNNTSALWNGMAVCEISPYDVGHNNEELVVLLGNKEGTSTYHYNGSFNFTMHIYGVGHGYAWDSRLEKQVDLYVLDPTANGYAASLRRYGTREASRRLTGSQFVTRDGDSISMSGSTATLTDAAATFVAQDVGRQILIYNTVNDGNAGLFVITEYVSATQVRFINALGVNETSAFGWTMPQKIDMLMGTMLIKDKDNAENNFELFGKTYGLHTGQYNVAKNTAVNVVNYADYMHFADGGMFEFLGFVGEHV